MFKAFAIYFLTGLSISAILVGDLFWNNFPVIIAYLQVHRPIAGLFNFGCMQSNYLDPNKLDLIRIINGENAHF